MRKLNLILKILSLLMCLVGAICLWRLVQHSENTYTVVIIPICLSIITIFMIVLWCYPYGKEAIEAGLRNIGFTNSLGETPGLVRRYRDSDNPHIMIFEFKNPGIPLKTWEIRQPEIEAGINKTILQMKYLRGKRRIQVYAVSARKDVPITLHWKDKYISDKEFTLILGENLLGVVTLNLEDSPHVLLGGATGSGKSTLLRLLLMQALRKGANIYIADFKGGVDFPKAWHRKCRMCFDETNLLMLLTELVDEIERRKVLFRDAECPNIVEFNKSTGQMLKRHIFACDEVAEIFEKAQQNKEQKALFAQIENKLSIIARQGRAFGIHLILATQRPDANLIPGQIRTNLVYRICGRADSILSKIVLDNTLAAEQISKEAKGRFMLYDGTLFQSYWFDEHCI